jgi:hypothetical protein
MRILSALLAAMLLMTPSIASGNPAGAISTQADSPIRITACNSKVQHIRSGGTDADNLHLSVDFMNTSDRDVVAVLIGFEIQNQFGDDLGDISTQASGNFSPKAAIADQHWDGADEWPGLSTIVCSVQRVLFKDGTVWRADMIGTPAPKASAG